MNIVVLKYGGTSLANPEKMKMIAARIASVQEEGKDVVVVTSAMGKTTDELLALARDFSASPCSRELSSLLSTGEVVSSSLMALALQALGKSAVSLNGQQAGINAHGDFDMARINRINPERIIKLLRQRTIAVVAGYQGKIDDDIAVLGRGGSDASAVALAAAVDAEYCGIYSDVSGSFYQ